MGQNIGKPAFSSFQNTFSSPKSSQPLSSQSTSIQPSIFSTLKRPPVSKPSDFIPLFNDCVYAASSRTQEYLLFKDPENKFNPNPDMLTQVFLMTYISQSVSLNMTDTFSCTTMTPEQRIILGADWVWAILEKPTKNPQVQIAVQVLHMPEREDTEENSIPPEAFTESVQIAQKESNNKTKHERLVDFCTSIGKDCYALFLFFGKKNDRGNIYGVLSNNFGAAIGKCKIDRVLIESFFKGSRYFHTPSGMMRAIVTKKMEDPLTLLIKFS